ncbi:MAG: DUF302 domain-containing protein [Actinomycetia bacterium]|nr:DUF302 domain-containing protein [Actinomycetes bacterium]MCP5035782.1 DUF302 domain-containing protein [Actinomycetes bacterium]
MIHENTVVLPEPFDDALALVKEAFAAQGFGTLTEIDVKATLKQKIDKDMDRYVIVGACNPRLASQAIDTMPQIGALLPCNVVVRQTTEGVMVEAMDPALMAKVTDNPALIPIADEAAQLVGNALHQLQLSTSTVS